MNDNKNFFSTQRVLNRIKIVVEVINLNLKVINLNLNTTLPTFMHIEKKVLKIL